MLKIFLSSTFRDLEDARSEILTKLNSAFEGVGMEKFIPDGKSSHEICIGNLKESDIVVFLLSPYYGSLMDSCLPDLKDVCKAECPMKTGQSRISYTHCEYKTTIAEGILHQTYLIEPGWNDSKVKEEVRTFKTEVEKEEFRFGIKSAEDPSLFPMICNNLADKILEWHSQKKLDFTDFCDRSGELNDILNNIDETLEVYGVGGIGKTALIQIALLIQRLRGKEILTIGVEQSYGSGSGHKYFREKPALKQYQHTITSTIITIHDILDALCKISPELKEVKEKLETTQISKNEAIKILQKFVKSRENLILFIDDFHNADEDVREFVENVNKLVFSTRRTTHLAIKELCIVGIREEDRLDFINLLCRLHKKTLSDEEKETILKITDGHPISTELLVRNSEYITFSKLKEFDLKNDLKNVNSFQVERFLRRVVKEVLSDNAYNLLRNLSMLNVNLESNIERESVEVAFEGINSNEIFNELISTGMLKRKEGKDVYEFSYKHVQDALEDITDKERHENAIRYYDKKKEIVKDKYTVNDDVEVFYHQVKSNPTGELVDEMMDIKKRIFPVHHGFRRLIEVGEELKSLMNEEGKARILVVLGMLFYDLGRFTGAEHEYKEAVEIFRTLADEPNVATTMNNLGVLYGNLGRFKEAEHAYTEALEIRKELADKNPKAYNPYVARTQNNLGILYQKLGKFKEAETVLKKSLDFFKELADRNPDAYLPNVAMTQNNLGSLFDDLGRFKEAEHAYTEALEIRKELADKNPEAYLPYVATTRYNLGNLYQKSGRLEEAEIAYNKALEVRKKLAEKNPEAYLYTLTLIQGALGVLYHDQQDYNKAEKIYKEVLQVYERLAEKYPQVYLSEVFRALRNLRILYNDLKKPEEAEEISKKIEELEKKKRESTF